jgi:hypothetical protein
MAIKKSHENLPAKQKFSPHEPPSKDSIFAKPMAEKYEERYVAKYPDGKAMAAEAWFRHSDAGKCGRALHYNLAGFEPSEPLGLADHYRFSIGHLIHEEFQQIFLELYPDDVEVEFVVTSPPQWYVYGKDLSAGHGDLALTHEDGSTVVEAKTINGFGFQRSVGVKYSAEGPRHSAKLQGALNAHCKGADDLVILVFSLDCINAGEAFKQSMEDWQRFAGEWHYDKDTFTQLAVDELARFAMILDYHMGATELAPRQIPDPAIPPDARITNPANGTWTVEEDGQVLDAGKTWHCNYCPHQKRCIADALEGK